MNTLSRRCIRALCGVLAAVSISQLMSYNAIMPVIVPEYDDPEEAVQDTADTVLSGENPAAVPSSYSRILFRLHKPEVMAEMSAEINAVYAEDSGNEDIPTALPTVEDDNSDECEINSDAGTANEKMKSPGGGVKAYTKKDFVMCDIPLTEEQQRKVWSIAEEFDVDPIILFGIMNNETRYRIGVNSKNGKYLGIMQIAKSNLKTLTKNIGVTDLEDFEQNVRSGAYFVSIYYKKYEGDINKTLMCYHCGAGNAKKKWDRGVTEDNYCIKAKAEMTRISGINYDAE